MSLQPEYGYLASFPALKSGSKPESKSNSGQTMKEKYEQRAKQKISTEHAKAQADAKLLDYMNEQKSKMSPATYAKMQDDVDQLHRYNAWEHGTAQATLASDPKVAKYKFAYGIAPRV